ncbi:MAG: family 10 glycosylhydrolase [Armatimonadetes bacterium]|nr:family 10 glycosylhydrolase [Armatimonadota bacterium]
MLRGLIACLLIIVLFSTISFAQPDDFRSILVDAWYWGSGYAIISPEAIQETVNRIKSWNCNAILIQVRKRCDAYYSSSIEPLGTDPSPNPGFDPLADMVSKAHQAGLEVHTWVVPYRVWTLPTPPPHTMPEHIYYLHPEWFSQYANGDKLWDGRYTSLDPGLPEVENYLIQVFLDIVSRYDIDGFLLDYIRYYDIGWGYNPAAVGRFNSEYGRTGLPSSMDPLWQEWRRNQVSNLVKRTYLEIKAIKPHVKVGALVWRTAASGRAEVLQDWDKWMASHWLDYASPMNYTTDNQTFYTNALDSLSRSYGHHIYMGIDGEMNSISNSIWQIENARNAGFPGMHLYSYAHPNAGVPDQDGFKAALLAGPYPTPATVPAMPWLNNPTKGYLKGFIRNEAGNAVYPATAKILELGLSDKNSGTGFYGFSEITPGTYTICVEAPGYTAIQKTTTILAGQVACLDFTLQHETSPPTISNVRVENVHATHVQIKWDTNEPATSMVEYGISPNYENSSMEDMALVTSHTVQLSGLKPLTTYHFRVKSWDAARNMAYSSDYIFTTTANDEPYEIIIDNLDAGCSAYGDWWTGTIASQKYGANYFYTTTADPRRFAIFRPEILIPGLYDIYIWYTTGTNRSTQAKWRVYYDGGMEEFRVNEQINGGKWNLLVAGKPFARGNSGYVATYSDTGETSTMVIIADAVKFVPSAITIADAKNRPDGMPVVLAGKVVSAGFGDHFYICESKEEQVSGIRVNGASPAEGSYVNVSGTLDTMDGERVITPWSINSYPGPGTPNPLLMLTRCAGGARLNQYTPGVSGGIGTNNIGLLITIAGRVIRLADSFKVDDGSGTPLEVDCSNLTSFPDEGSFVLVTGISRTKQTEDKILPLIKPRRDSDIIKP